MYIYGFHVYVKVEIIQVLVLNYRLVLRCVMEDM